MDRPKTFFFFFYLFLYFIIFSFWFFLAVPAVKRAALAKLLFGAKGSTMRRGSLTFCGMESRHVRYLVRLQTDALDDGVGRQSKNNYPQHHCVGKLIIGFGRRAVQQSDFGRCVLLSPDRGSSGLHDSQLLTATEPPLAHHSARCRMKGCWL